MTSGPKSALAVGRLSMFTSLGRKTVGRPLPGSHRPSIMGGGNTLDDEAAQGGALPPPPWLEEAARCMGADLGSGGLLAGVSVGGGA